MHSWFYKNAFSLVGCTRVYSPERFKMLCENPWTPHSILFPPIRFQAIIIHPGRNGCVYLNKLTYHLRNYYICVFCYFLHILNSYFDDCGNFVTDLFKKCSIWLGCLNLKGQGAASNRFPMFFSSRRRRRPSNPANVLQDWINGLHGISTNSADG